MSAIACLQSIKIPKYFIFGNHEMNYKYQTEFRSINTLLIFSDSIFIFKTAQFSSRINKLLSFLLREEIFQYFSNLFKNLQYSTTILVC